MEDTMQSLPFNLPLEQHPPVFLTDTDTATPRQQTPIFYIHSLKQPFCRNFDCACHRHQREIANLLRLITEGIMTLEEAARFVNEEGKEGDA